MKMLSYGPEKENIEFKTTLLIKFCLEFIKKKMLVNEIQSGQ